MFIIENFHYENRIIFKKNLKIYVSLTFFVSNWKVNGVFVWKPIIRKHLVKLKLKYLQNKYLKEEEEETTEKFYSFFFLFKILNLKQFKKI